MARRRRGFIDASPPPRRAATVISLMRRVKILPRLASVAAFLCLMFAHLLWPAMVSSCKIGSGNYTASAGAVALDALDLQVFVDAELAPLAAVARLLVAAERRAAIDRRVVDLHVAGAQPARHAPRALEVLPTARRRQGRTACRWRCAPRRPRRRSAMMHSTGPKISSRAMVMAGSTSTKTVGRTKKPRVRPAGRPGPPAASCAPSAMPRSIRRCTFSNCAAVRDRPQRRALVRRAARPRAARRRLRRDRRHFGEPRRAARACASATRTTGRCC